jgi:hypothetical protein
MDSVGIFAGERESGRVTSAYGVAVDCHNFLLTTKVMVLVTLELSWCSVT